MEYAALKPKLPNLRELKMIRTIQTTYMLHKQLVKTTQAVHANTAVTNCVNHMQLNHYGATVAEVFDSQSGVLHAVICRKMDGSGIEIVFKRVVKEGM